MIENFHQSCFSVKYYYLDTETSLALVSSNVMGYPLTATKKPLVSLLCLVFGVFRRENSFHFFSSKCLICSILQCRTERPSVFTGDLKTIDIFQKYKGDKKPMFKNYSLPQSRNKILELKLSRHFGTEHAM